MKSIFISDLHLNASEPDVYHAFRRFIHDLPVDLDELYILGDLFEAWIGDDDPDDFVAKVKNDLYGITHSGIKLKVQHGNRDFALGKRFCRETGAELIGDHHIFERYGQKALLMHGDLLCTDDEAYQRFRRKVHNPIYNFIIRNMPLSSRRKLADKWRSQSKDMNRNKPENIMDVNADAVSQVMHTHDVSTLIHGHTHRPDIHHLVSPKQRIVLGDWAKNIWWIRADKQGFHLRSAPISSAQPLSTLAVSYTHLTLPTTSRV